MIRHTESQGVLVKLYRTPWSSQLVQRADQDRSRPSQVHERGTAVFTHLRGST